MHCKLAVIVVTGFLPFITLGDTTNIKSSVSSPATLNVTTNQEPQALRFKIICRSGAVMTLDHAALLERAPPNRGSIPGGTAPVAIRLNIPDAGTVTIPWVDIEKITVGDRHTFENTYPIEVTLKNVNQTKVGKTYGYDNTIVGQSDAGEFSIQLKDVKEIIMLPPSEKK